MKKRSIGSRLLSALLAVVMVIGMVPAMRFSASAITSEGHGMSLTSKDYITMPIKIMDYEADGMLFDYLMGRNGYVDTTSYVPESPYWMDFTGTLTDSTATGNGKATSAGGRNVYHGSGIESVSLATTGGTYGGSKWATISSSSLGGKSLLHIVNNKTNGIPLQWQIADFNGSKNVKDVRYAVIVFRAYNCSTLSAPQISISKNLSETKSVREQSGAYSGPYYLNKTGTVNVCGDRHVDMAVIDLKNLTGTVDKLYLEFPMDTSLTDVDEKQSDGTTKKVRPTGAKFDLISVGFFPNEGDAYQYGYWASTLGAASDTDYWDSAKTDAIPKDDYDNNNQVFSFFTDSTSTFGDVGNIVKWLAASSDGVPRTTAGQQPLVAYKTTDLTDYDDPYEFNIWTNTSANFAWSDTNTVTVEEALGYRLYQVVGQSQANGYATIGLLESSLDENGLPVYKESVLNYMQIFLRNRMRDVYEFELDGWRNYSAIAGTPNGEIFGYTDGGMVDMDPNISGIQGVPMDFATALCKQLNVTRRTVDKANGVQTTGKVGSYEATMKKRKYLEGSWLDCKQYITSWWDAAYYMMHNLWVPNSYNKLQSDYNYMNLYKSTNTSSTSHGHYVFDSSLTSVNASPYTSGVTYNKTTKTIGLSGATYTAYFGAGEAYNPFVPVHYKGGAAGESNTPYYLDDGVNSFTNPLTVTATNGAYKLSGSDTHTVFAFGEPAYFQWANHKIVIDSEKLYEDLKNSKTYGDKDIPAPGHMAITLCDGVGNPMEYPCVSNSVGGDVYITAAYKTAGLYTVYANISDKTGAAPTFTIAIMFYVLDDKDTAVVLDYGLVADLSSGNSLLGKDVLNLAGKEVLNTVIGITGVSGTVEYIEQDVSNLHAVVNTENTITPVSANKSSYIGKFDTPVYLRHDLPWVIEWKTNGSHSGGLMFSMTEVGATADNLYIYTRNYSNGKETSSNPDFIALGHYHNGAYDNYGVNLTAKGYSLNTAQTYRLENRPNTDGTNKVYVHINGTEVGSLDTYWIATTQQSTDVSYITGKDFTFNYLGAGGHPIDLTNYEYIHIYEDGFELNNYRSLHELTINHLGPIMKMVICPTTPRPAWLIWSATLLR